MLRLLTPIMLFSSFRNIYTKPISNSLQSQSKRTEKHKFIEILPIISWQCGSFLILTYCFGPFGYLLYWILPIFIASYLDITRVFCEHSSPIPDFEADKSIRLSSFEPSCFGKLFLAPHNMHKHAIHHIYPQVPYQNLKSAEKLLASSTQFSCSKINFKKSYFNTLVSHLRYCIYNKQIV